MGKENINIGKVMREEAWQKMSKRKKKKYRVSPGAIKEMISYIRMGIEINIPQICEMVDKTKHPNTIKEEDVIRFFDYKDSDVFYSKEEKNE